MGLFWSVVLVVSFGCSFGGLVGFGGCRCRNSVLIDEWTNRRYLAVLVFLGKVSMHSYQLVTNIVNEAWKSLNA